MRLAGACLSAPFPTTARARCAGSCVKRPEAPAPARAAQLWSPAAFAPAAGASLRFRITWPVRALMAALLFWTTPRRWEFSAMVPARVRRMGGVAGARCAGTDVADTDVLSFGSLAKGFGVPVAVLAGSQDAVWRFERESQTRVHCSPPSVAVVQAACHALALNRRCGETLRGRLVERVKQFRARLAEAGLGASGGLFPVQTLKPMPGIDPHALHGRLERLGIQTVLHSKPDGNGARLGFILTARHSPEEIDAAVAVVVDALGHQRSARQASKMEVHNERSVCI